MSILIIEDEEDNIELLKEIMKIKDYKFEIARDGKTALELLKKQLYKLIILDISLPEISGVEIIKSLKSFFPNTAVPVLVITGSLGTINKNSLSNFGINNFLKKPIKIDQFLQIIDSLMKS